MPSPLPRVTRWIRPAWLDYPQASAYCGLPAYVLDALVTNRWVRTRATRAGRLINRNSIDQLLLEAIVSRQPICFGPK